MYARYQPGSNTRRFITPNLHELAHNDTLQAEHAASLDQLLPATAFRGMSDLEDEDNELLEESQLLEMYSPMRLVGTSQIIL